jgi:nucleoside-diphosphate-sugar epimerase
MRANGAASAVFLAGGTGVIGRRLIPLLRAAGHRIVAMTRRPERMASLQALGAEAAVCDVFDRGQLETVVRAAGAEIVVHQLTSLPPRIDPRRVDRDLAATNRLRVEGTRNLVAAAEAAGAKRFIAQSVAFAHRPDGSTSKTEEDPLFLDSPPRYRPLVEAIDSLERQVAAAALESVVLRYGYFYGPGTIYAPGGSFYEDVKRRRMPVVGGGTGIFSFVHLDDAASATVAALTGPPGLYQIVDDDPAPVHEWLPYYAEVIGAPPPRRVPVWLTRLAVGSFGVTMMLEQRGASNRRAREVLGWEPAFASWRRGFRDLAAQAACENG